MNNNITNNPYQYLSPIHDMDKFFGRKTTLQRIYASITHGNNISILGPRRTGKSSLLWILYNATLLPEFERGKSRYLPIHIDFKAHYQQKPKDFLNNITEQIVQRSQGILDLFLSFEDGIDGFRLCLAEINRQKYSVILLLDNFEKLMQNPEIDIHFLYFLRSMANSGYISYVTASTAPLDEIAYGDMMGSPFFNIFEYIYLEPLTEEEALELIHVPSRAISYTFSTAEVEWVLQLAGRHPFVLQCVCHFLLDEKYQQDSLPVELPNFSLEKYIYLELCPHFELIYNSLNPRLKAKLLSEMWQPVPKSYEVPLFSESRLFRYFIADKHGQEWEAALDMQYSWKFMTQFLQQHIYQRGSIDLTVFPEVPTQYITKLFKHYLREYPRTDLQYNEQQQQLRLQTFERVDAINKIIETFPVSGRHSLNLEKLLATFFSSIGLKIVSTDEVEGFLVLRLDTKTVFENLHFPQPLLIVTTTEKELSEENLERLHHLLNNTLDARIALLFLFCNTKNLNLIKSHLVNFMRGIYARDVAALNQQDLLDIVAARYPEQLLRRIVLSQINLVLVAPYTRQGPTPAHFFFGRERELREITQRVSDTSYVITGGRRIGKTSIMHRLHQVRLPAAGFHTLYFDCSVFSSTKEFLNSSAIDSETGKFVTLKDALSQISPDNKPIVLLLDEADKLIPSDSYNGWPIFNTLRAFVNSKRGQIVFSGERTLRESLRNSTSPFYNFGSELLIGRLERSAVEELVKKPMKQLEIDLVKEKAIVECIWQFSSGHPNIVQILCSRLIENLNFQNRYRLTLKDVQELVHDYRFQRHDFLDTYWERATLLERIVSLIIAQKSQQWYTLRDVCDLLNIVLKQNTADVRKPSNIEVDGALDRLTDLRCILQHTHDGYTFAVSAFPLVIKQLGTASIDDLFYSYSELYRKYGDLTFEEAIAKETIP